MNYDLAHLTDTILTSAVSRVGSDSLVIRNNFNALLKHEIQDALPDTGDAEAWVQFLSANPDVMSYFAVTSSNMPLTTVIAESCRQYVYHKIADGPRYLNLATALIDEV